MFFQENVLENVEMAAIYSGGDELMLWFPSRNMYTVNAFVMV